MKLFHIEGYRCNGWWGFFNTAAETPIKAEISARQTGLTHITKTETWDYGR